MKQENIDQLVQLYPSLFDITSMPEISCDDGWFHIVDRLCARIVNHLAMRPCPVSGLCVITCIKEKFGKLRVYVSSGDDMIYQMIDEAEEKSAVTCEVSGKPGKMHRKGFWMKTLAPDIAEEMGYAKVYYPRSENKVC